MNCVRKRGPVRRGVGGGGSERGEGERRKTGTGRLRGGEPAGIKKKNQRCSTSKGQGLGRESFLRGDKCRRVKSS